MRARFSGADGCGEGGGGAHTMLTVRRVDGGRCDIDIVTTPDSDMPNAVRRSLLADVPCFAPARVVFEENTTCQTDEYVAHRISMIPFRCTLGADARAAAREDPECCPELALDVDGRTAFAADLTGEGFAPVLNVPIMKMTTGQRLRCVVRFEYAAASRHVRHSQIGPVAYRFEDVAGRGRAKPAKRTTIGFDSHVEPPLVVLDAALGALEAHLERALRWVDSEGE